jgi:pimeloyl-ACP methyl ester carboxylesterase
MVTRSTSILAAAVLAAGLCAAVPQSAGAAARTAAAAPAGTLKWGKCKDPFYSSQGVQCATIAVPLDYRHPNGRKIHLAIDRRVHTSSASDYRGAILVNFGGPGESGQFGALMGDYVPNHVGDDYDWIGFDPRGVGSSTPHLSCISNYFKLKRPDYRPVSTKVVDTWLRRSKNYADACNNKHHALLQHLTTLDTVRDINQIRIGLGVKKISFYGYSYGTYIGQVLATKFPGHLAQVVMDSTVNPARDWYLFNFDQDRAFNRNAKIYFRWLAKYHSVYKLGKTEKAVQNLYFTTLDRLSKHPAGGNFTASDWTDSFTYAGYYRFTWLQLADAFAAAVHKHHWGQMREFYVENNSPDDDSGFAVYLGVECTDGPWPHKWSRFRAANVALDKKAPFYTWGNAWFNAPCLYWHAPSRKPFRINGKRAKSVLFIDETLDAATPYPGSLRARKLFPHSSLIAEPGGATHADTLSGDACVDDLIARYLRTGKRPARQRWNGPDYLCRPLSDPVPSRASGSGGTTQSGDATPAYARARLRQTVFRR